MSVNILLAYTHRQRVSLAAVNTRIGYSTSPKDRRVGLYSCTSMNTAFHCRSMTDAVLTLLLINSLMLTGMLFIRLPIQRFMARLIICFMACEIRLIPVLYLPL